MPVVVALVVAVALVAPGDGAVAIAAALVAAVGAIDAAWVLIGRGRTGLLLVLTVVPRVVGTLAGAGLVLAGSALVLLPLVQLLGTAVAVVLSTAAVRLAVGRGRSWSTSRLELADGLRQQGHGTLTALLAAVYVAMPIVAVARLAPGGLASLGLADRIMRYGVFALGSVFGLAQAWVPAAGPERLPGRAGTAAQAGVAIGAAAAVVYLLAAPFIAVVLSAGAVDVPFSVIAGYAVAAGAILTTQVVGPAALVGLGGVRQLSRTTFAGALVGVIVIAGGTLLLGVTGTAIGFAASEVVVLVLQLRALRRLLAERRAEGALAGTQ